MLVTQSVIVGKNLKCRSNEEDFFNNYIAFRVWNHINLRRNQRNLS